MVSLPNSNSNRIVAQTIRRDRTLTSSRYSVHVVVIKRVACWEEISVLVVDWNVLEALNPVDEAFSSIVVSYRLVACHGCCVKDLPSIEPQKSFPTSMMYQVNRNSADVARCKVKVDDCTIGSELTVP